MFVGVQRSALFSSEIKQQCVPEKWVAQQDLSNFIPLFERFLIANGKDFFFQFDGAQQMYLTDSKVIFTETILCETIFHLLGSYLNLPIGSPY